MARYYHEGKLDNVIHDVSPETIMTMYKDNLSDMNECQKITSARYQGEDHFQETEESSRIQFYRDAFRDQKTNGFIMRYPYGTVIRQGTSEDYYRGENAVFPQSIPSLNRKINTLSDMNEKAALKIIAYMRIKEFDYFIHKFDIVKDWEYSSVLFELLAQHYGLDTQWLDITSDFNVALFFANCYYCHGAWHPLLDEQTKDESKKYGIIFHRTRWENSAISLEYFGMSNSKSNAPLKKGNIICPIGYQPFMRCSAQHAYAIKMSDDFPLQEDISFEKLRFRHSEKLAKFIFNKMDQGGKIYPYEGLLNFEDVIQNIKNASNFSEGAFEWAFEKQLKECGAFKDINACRSYICNTALLGKPITITEEDHPFHVSRQRVRALNRKYKDFSIEKYYNIKLNTRYIYLPKE